MSTTNWRDDEIRDSVVYDQITNRLLGRGVCRTKAQITNKLKTLKRQYHQVVSHRAAANEPQTWCYFGMCDAIWGSGHSPRPVALVGDVEATSTPGITSTLSPQTAAMSALPETPCSDPEEPTKVCEIDVSVNDPVARTGSSCHSPPEKRRRNQLRSERLITGMRDLFSEMDKDFNEKERLRLLEQREYEERVRTEARGEKAQELAFLRDVTSLLRQMVQRMPATQPQQPSPAPQTPPRTRMTNN